LIKKDEDLEGAKIMPGYQEWNQKCT